MDPADREGPDAPPRPPRSEYPSREVMPSNLPPPVEAPPARPPVEVMPSNLPPPLSLPSPAPSPSPSRDPRLDEVVALVEQNAWAKVRAQLEPSRDALPASSASLGLLYAVARREDELSRGRADGDAVAERLARESLALLLGVPTESAVARILARRVLRHRWSAAPAPTARTSAIIVAVAIALGALVGWLVDQGVDRVLRR